MPSINVPGAPDVNPGGPPADYQNIQANPAQFGGLIAQGVQRLGQGGQQGGNDLTQAAIVTQQRFNEVASTDAFNQLQKRYYDLTFGDPSNPDQKGIYSMHGADALRAGPVVTKKMDDIRSEISNGLQNDAQRLMFEQTSRRLQMYTADSIGRHLDAQGDAYAQAVNAATTHNQIAAITAQFNDDTGFNHSLEEMRRASVQNAQVRYGSNPDPQIVSSELDRATNQAIVARIQAWQPHDAVGASNWLEHGMIPQAGTGKMIPVKQAVDPSTYFTLSRELKGAADAASVDGTVQSVISGGSLPRRTASPDDIDRAIHGQESGGAATAPTSVNGAVGGHQIQPATFAQYAKPGEVITNSADNAAVGKRIVADLSQKYGNDPARVAVAYFSGPGNVAPPDSPTPWIEDKKDGNGVSTSAYVAGVLGHIARSSPTNPPIGTPTARDASIPPRYFSDVQMMGRAYKAAATMRPDLGKRVIDGVWEHIQRENTLENQAESRADHDLNVHQRDNGAILFGAAVQGQTMDDSYLGNLLRTQQITPSTYNAIKAVQQKQAEGTDDPMIVARVWDGIGSDKVTSDDIFNGLSAGKISGKTADEMIRALNTRSKTQVSAVEKGDYETLKTALGGHAIESGLLDIFGKGKVDAAQLWTQAQGEWSRRVIVGKEDPNAVLADMMPRYQKSIPSRPAAWPNPRFGMVQDLEDVASVAAKTKAAFQGGQITQDTYNVEGDLLARYKRYFQQMAGQKAAADKVPAPRGAKQPAALMPATSE